jgi:hypothetical protein
LIVVIVVVVCAGVVCIGRARQRLFELRCADAPQTGDRSSSRNRLRTDGRTARQAARKVRSSSASPEALRIPSRMRWRTAGSAIRAFVASLIRARASGVMARPSATQIG